MCLSQPIPRARSTNCESNLDSRGCPKGVKDLAELNPESKERSSAERAKRESEGPKKLAKLISKSIVPSDF